MTATVRLNGTTVSVPEGMTLAAVLVQAGLVATSANPVSGQPRGPFCGMGACFECEVLVNGFLERACLTPSADGMVVETTRGPAGIGANTG